MPELPEVEVLVRHLGPLIQGRTIREVAVRRARVIAPTPLEEFSTALAGATFTGVSRRGKYLLFTLAPPVPREPLLLVGHLGMTGRMYLLPKAAPLPTHAAVVMNLGDTQFVYEDTRYFGRLTLDASGPAKLGPEPFAREFTAASFAASLKRSAQAVKIRLLDQTMVAGVGNIYASEALFLAGISPRRAARRLRPDQIAALCHAIREVLNAAIQRGSTLPLDFSGAEGRDGLFYYGGFTGAGEPGSELLRVYDREGLPCLKCGTAIKRIVQAARATFFCPRCQRG